MPLVIDPGPLFKFEVIAAARRWQTYALRVALIGMLLAALFFVYINDWRIWSGRKISLNDYADLGRSFATTILITQMAIIMLAAPAATAGAICLDKARGNMTLLMGSMLSSAEIVLGKLGARMIPVFALIAASIPVLFIASLLGGISGEFVAGGFIVMIDVAIFTAATAFLFSMWVGRTHEALLLTYFVIFAWLLFYPVFDGLFGWRGPSVRWLLMQNPIVMLLWPLTTTGAVTEYDYVWFCASTLGGAALLMLFAIWRMRKVMLSEANKGARKRWKLSFFRRSRSTRLLDRWPLRWYERHRKRPTRAGRIVNLLYAFSVIASTVWSLNEMLNSSGAHELAAFVVMFQIGVGLLLTTVHAVTALSDERARGGLDILMATPVETRAIVWAKWRSAFVRIPWILVLPLLIGAFQACFGSVIVRPGRQSHDELVPVLVAFLVVLPLAAGIFFVSLSLYLATRVRQFGRAVSLAVAIYVAMSVGLPFFVMAISPKNDEAAGIIVGSPAFGPGFILAMLLIDDAQLRPAVVIGSAIWSGVYIVFAILFYWVTVRIFNSCMGRIAGRPKPRRPVRVKRKQMRRGLGVEWVEPRGMP
jgi:ABC-type transport system involved in multi-copper enzyme maturation permease subunit